MSACGNYVENVWRKGKCANCFRSMSEHANQHKVKDGGIQEENSNGNRTTANGINGHCEGDGDFSKELSDNKGDNSIRAKRSDETKGVKTESQNCTARQSPNESTGNSRREKRDQDLDLARNTGRKESSDCSCIQDKPKPVPRPRARGFSRSSSSSQEDILNFRPSSAASASSECSRSCSTPDDFEDREQLDISSEESKLDKGPSDCTNNLQTQESLNELYANSQARESIGDLETIDSQKGVNAQGDGKQNNVRNSPSELKNSTGSGRKNLKGLTTKYMDGNHEGDEYYMPMKNNVCEVITGDNRGEPTSDTKHPACDKILKQSLSDSSVDRDAEQLSAKETTKLGNCTGTESMDRKLNGSVGGSEGEIKGMLDMGCEPASYTCMDEGLLEPYYENQQSVEEDRKRSMSSSSSVSMSNGPLVRNSCVDMGNGMSSIDRHVSVEETSVFQEIIPETSGSTTESSSSSESSWGSSNGSGATDSKVVLKQTPVLSSDIKRITQPVMPFDPELAKKRQSNPDIKAKIEGPVYINAEAKPLTKPYKVVDISAGVLYREEGGEEISDTPPLPPKERELKEIREDDTFDHYYCEPPEDIVPDYKKLTPLQNKEPAPEIEIKRNPGAINALPIPRPRSQLHVSTLPRPVPRAKGAKGLEVGNQTVRPASQVVLRSTRLDAPTPPSTSTIPTRKPSTGISSPPTSPTETRPRTPASPEGPIHEGGEPPKDNKDQGLKPRRVAPPPPMGNQHISPSKPKSAPEIDKEHNSPLLKSKTSPKSKRVTSETIPEPATTVSNTMDQAQVNVSPVAQVLNTKGQTAGTLAQTTGKSSPKMGLKRALWKRLSGRRKGKRKLDISSPILVNEEIPSFAAQQDTLRKRTSFDPTQPVCTSIRELNSEEKSSPLQEKTEETTANGESPNDKGKDKPKEGTPRALPFRKRGNSYQNFPFSKSGPVEKPRKPERPGKAPKPVQEVKPTENNPPTLPEDPAYLEPCKDQMTLKVETALANLNDAQILAEALSRVEQEKLGPLPEVPKSRHVHFKFNATQSSAPDKKAAKDGKPSIPKRPVVAKMVNGAPERPSPPKYPSRPPNTKIPEPSRGRSKSLGAVQNQALTAETTRERSLSIQNNSIKNRYTRILEMHIETLQDVIASNRATLLPGDTVDLSSTQWGDYTVCADPLTIRGPGAVLLPVQCQKLEKELPLLARVKYPKAVIEDMSQRTAFMRDVSITVSLPTHPNISRTLTHFTGTLPGQIFGLQGDADWETLVTITDQVPVESLAEFLERTKEEHAGMPEEYERKVCLLVMQVFSALEHLHAEGVIHRDVSSDNIFLLDHGHLILANFGQALQQPKDTRPTRFVFNAEVHSSEISDITRLPPEITSASSESTTLDFEKCDVFSAGCLIYELLHEDNPFKADPSLLKSDYSIEQLPQFTERSRFTCGLGALASGLLERDPSERILPREALQLLQAFLWGPEELDESYLELSATDWLETERACAVVMIARSQSQKGSSGEEGFIENYLKYQYLVEVSEEEVVNGYKALTPVDTQTVTL